MSKDNNLVRGSFRPESFAIIPISSGVRLSCITGARPVIISLQEIIAEAHFQAVLRGGILEIDGVQEFKHIARRILSTAGARKLVDGNMKCDRYTTHRVRGKKWRRQP